MEDSASNVKLGIEEQKKSILEMLSEIKEHLESLEKLNDRLFEAASKSSSEYGDRKLQHIQSRLIWMQKVLYNSENKLTDQSVLIEEYLKGRGSKKLEEITKIHNFCEESAIQIKQKIANFFKETNHTLSLYFKQ